MGEWRPIETAPLNVWVLVCWADHPAWAPLVLRYEVDRWTDHEDSTGYRLPTHWMPLPAPPQEADRGE